MMENTHPLKSTQILDDCQRSLALLEEVPDGDKQLFRIYWTFCLVALRGVEDALLNSDAKTYPGLKPLLEKRHDELMALKDRYPEDVAYDICDSEDYLIYHRLIRGERNAVVHRLSQSYVDTTWFAISSDEMFDGGNIYLPMSDSDKWGHDDCRDWMQKGIDWWRKEIDALVKGLERLESGGSHR